MTDTAAKPFTVSVSKIEMKRRCKVKYVFAHVMNVQMPPNKSKSMGIDVHNLAENYLKTGKAPHEAKAGAVFAAGMHLLPQPGTVLVEQWLRMTIAAPDPNPATRPHNPGIELVGKVDFFDPDRMVATSPVHAAVRVPLISDHKTHGDFKWCLTADELARNVQMLTYARGVGLWEGRAAPTHVDLEHVNYRTKGQPLATRTGPVRVAWSEVERNWREVAADAVDIKGLHHLASVNGPDMLVKDPKLANPGACGDYGGCPFADRCPHSPTARQTGAQATAMQNAAGGKAPSMTTTPAPQAQSTRQTMTEAQRQALLFGDGAAPAKPPAAAAPAPTPKPASAPATGAGTAITPPDAGAQSHQTEALFQDGAKQLAQAVDIAGFAQPAFLARLCAKLGIAPENTNRVIALAGMVVVNGRIEKGTAAPTVAQVQPADPKPPAASEPVDAPAEYIVQELRPGDWRAYDPEGETLKDDTGVFKFSSRSMAVAIARRHAANQPRDAAVDQTVHRAEVTAKVDELVGRVDAQMQQNAAPAVVTGNAPETTSTPAPVVEPSAATAQAEAEARQAATPPAKLNADDERAIGMLTAAVKAGQVSAPLVDDAIKSACSLSVLRKDRRAKIIGAGVERGLWTADAGGGITAPKPAAPTQAMDADLTVIANATKPPVHIDQTDFSEDTNATRVAQLAMEITALKHELAASKSLVADLTRANEALAAEHSELQAGVETAGGLPESEAPVVYVDCFPAGDVWPNTDLDNLIAHICAEVAAEAGVDHYNLLDYRNGPKRVASKLALALMQDPKRCPPAILVSSDHPCAADVIPVLRSVGCVVVRALR